VTRPQVEKTVNKDHYGYGWWVKGNEYPDMFEAVGRGGQRINVWPAKDLVLVFTGGEFEPGDLANFILQAIRSDDNLPFNPDSVAKLERRLTQATKPPTAQKPPKLPRAASRISDKLFTLSTMFPYAVLAKDKSWQPGPYPGVELMILHKHASTGGVVVLRRFKVGCTVPAHTQGS